MFWFFSRTGLWVFQAVAVASFQVIKGPFESPFGGWKDGWMTGLIGEEVLPMQA